MTPRRTRSLSSVVTVVLDVSWYLLAITLGLVVCVLIVTAVSDRPGEMQLSIPVSFDLDLQAERAPATTPAIEPARIERGNGTLIVPIQQGGFLYSTMTTLIVLLALGLWILSQLCAVFRTVRDGRPFTAANVNRIRWVGVGVILGELASAGSAFYGNQYAVTHLATDTIRFGGMPIVDPTRHHPWPRHSGHRRGLQGWNAAGGRPVAYDLRNLMAIRINLDRVAARSPSVTHRAGRRHWHHARQPLSPQNEQGPGDSFLDPRRSLSRTWLPAGGLNRICPGNVKEQLALAPR